MPSTHTDTNFGVNDSNLIVQLKSHSCLVFDPILFKNGSKSTPKLELRVGFVLAAGVEDCDCLLYLKFLHHQGHLLFLLVNRSALFLEMFLHL